MKTSSAAPFLQEEGHDDEQPGREGKDRSFARDRHVAALDLVAKFFFRGFFCSTVPVGLVRHERIVPSEDFFVVFFGIELEFAALGHFEGQVGDHPPRLDDLAMRRRAADG